MDPRFIDLKIDTSIWKKLQDLKIDDPLPEELPEYFYAHIHSYLQAGKCAERIESFLRHFPRHKSLSTTLPDRYRFPLQFDVRGFQGICCEYIRDSD